MYQDNHKYKHQINMHKHILRHIHKHNPPLINFKYVNLLNHSKLCKEVKYALNHKSSKIQLNKTNHQKVNNLFLNKKACQRLLLLNQILGLQLHHKLQTEQGKGLDLE